MLTLAARPPAAVGENVTEIVQVALATSDAGQSLVCWKSPAFAPPRPMLVIVSGAVPVFLSVDDCEGLVVPISCEPNARLGGVSVAAGAGVPPVPLRASACGLPVALSETCTVAARGPVALGEKVTVMVQVALAASDAGQSLVCVKSVAFAPVMAMPVIVSGAVPEFRSVEVCDALVVPTSCEPNVRPLGVSVTAGAVPVPVSATVCGLPAALSAI